MRVKPSFAEEKKLWKLGYELVIGMDEVGRGAFAGPVVVGAVVFSPKSLPIEHVNDSKLLKPSLREKLSLAIEQEAVFSITTKESVSVINKLGIGKATQMAFRKAIKIVQREFPNKRKFVLIDGFYIPFLKGIGLKNQKGIIKGDQKSISIAAASIIAKVKRDSIMKSLDKKYPEYGFAKHKGYGTKFHQEAIHTYGLTKLHRRSFNLHQFLPK